MEYPEYDRNKYTVWALPNLMIWHWVLNPGLAFNELILGQRIPKVMLIDRTSDQPLGLRTYVPCPHCGTLHSGLLWGRGNAFGHWYGYICPTCDKIIPCLRNWTSKVILIITYPLWFLPARLLRPRWLAYEKVRLNRNLTKPLDVPSTTRIYKRSFLGGICWGAFMWVAMCLVPFLYTYWTSTAHVVNIGPLVYGLPLWLGGGLAWGLSMSLFTSKKGKKVREPSTSSG